MLIQRAPDHRSLFKKEESRWSRLFDCYHFLLRTLVTGIFGWLAAKIAGYAFYQPEALVGMLVAFACLAIATYNGAIAAKLACRIGGMESKENE
jgi:hypothetical protein